MAASVCNSTFMCGQSHFRRNTNNSNFKASRPRVNQPKIEISHNSKDKTSRLNNNALINSHIEANINKIVSNDVDDLLIKSQNSPTETDFSTYWTPQEMRECIKQVMFKTSGYPRYRNVTSIQNKKLKCFYWLKCNLGNYVEKYLISESNNDLALSYRQIDIIPFGSFLMDGGFDCSDLNLLILLPHSLQLNWFTLTTHFVQFLTNNLANDQSPDFQITDISIIRSSYMPAWKFNLNGIPVDVIFATVILEPDKDYSLLPCSDYLFEDSLQENLSEKDVRALNAYRNCWTILQAVPSVDLFITLLRVIKSWAKARGIYSSMMGYLGGIAWSILTAQICCMYPNASFRGLIFSFFHVFSHWDWSKPISCHLIVPNDILEPLKSIYLGSVGDKFDLLNNNNLSCKNSDLLDDSLCNYILKLNSERIEELDESGPSPVIESSPSSNNFSARTNNLMFIFTPEPPLQNTAHNLTFSGFKRILQCFIDTYEELKLVGTNLNQFLDPCFFIGSGESIENGFFYAFPKYLIIYVKSRYDYQDCSQSLVKISPTLAEKKNHEKSLSEFCNLVESRLRILVKHLDEHCLISEWGNQLYPKRFSNFSQHFWLVGISRWDSRNSSLQVQMLRKLLIDQILRCNCYTASQEMFDRFGVILRNQRFSATIRRQINVYNKFLNNFDGDNINHISDDFKPDSN